MSGYETTTGSGNKPGINASGATTITGASNTRRSTDQDIADCWKGQLDALRAELAATTADRDSEERWAEQYKRERDASQAEVERLRGIIRKVENIHREWARQSTRVCCDSRSDDEHELDCPLYQWEAK